MLSQMRNFAKSWVATILLGILSLAFAMWGVGDIFQGRTSTDVATVGSREISLDEFQREYRTELRQRSQQGEFTAEMARAMNLGKQLLDRSMIRAALDNITAKLKLTVSDALVAAQIHNMPAFNGPLGTFDKGTFLRVAAENDFNEQGFINLIRNETARDQLLRAVQGGFEMPMGYVGAIYAFQTEVRGAAYFEIPASAVGVIPAPTDAQLTDYVKVHAASFSTPEYREVTYAIATPADVMSKIPAVTDAQLKLQYEARKETYVIAEKRDIEQITFPTEAEAKAARAKIDGGTSFAQVGKERGLAANELSIGTQTQTALGEPRGKAAFALAENAVSEPIKGPFGWVLMRVTKITPGESKTLAEVKDELTKAVQTQLAGGQLVDIANAYQEAVDSGDTLVDAAKKAGMRVVHLPAVDAKGLAPDGSKADLPEDPDLLAQIQKGEVGEEGEPFQTKTTNYYAVKVDGVTPPKLKPLADVRSTATEEWNTQQRMQRLDAKAKALAEQVTKTGIEAAAKSVGATVRKSPGLQRNQPGTLFSPALAAALFSKPATVGVYGPAANGDGMVVAVTTSVLHLPLPTGNPQFAEGVKRAGDDMGSDLTLSLASAALKKQGSRINQQRLNQVTGEGS